MRNFLSLVILLLAVNTYAQVITDNAVLQNTISSLNDGTIIELTDSKKADVQLAINVDGTENSPIKIYPIPSRNELNIFSDKTVIENIRIFDVQGKELLIGKASSNAVKINVSHLSSGVYILKANEFVSRFIVE